MPNIRMHVIASVDRTGQGRFDPIQQMTLDIPAAGKDGAALEADLGHVDHFVCDGLGVGTGQCTRDHAHASERVIARIRPDGEVAVSWRRYHPSIAAGRAAPGQPFEATDEQWGRRLRVEVREIALDSEDAPVGNALTEADLAALEAEIALAQAQFQFERQQDQLFRTEVHRLETQYRPRISAALGQMEAVLSASAMEGLRKVGETRLGQAGSHFHELFAASVAKGPPAADWKAGTAKLEAAYAAEAERLEAIANQVSNLPQARAALTALMGEANALLLELGTRPERTWVQLMNQVEAATEAHPVDEIEAVETATETLARLTDAVVPHRDALKEEVLVKRSERQRFANRVNSLCGWNGGESEQAWRTAIQQGQAFPGFGVAYWQNRFDAVASAVGQLASGIHPDMKLETSSHRQQLAKTEKSVRQQLSPFLEALTAEQARRSRGYDRTVTVEGRPFVLPHASVRVLASNRNRLQVEVAAVNRDDKAILLEVTGADGRGVVLPLGKQGERVSARLEEAVPPFVFKVQNVGTEKYEGEGEVSTVPADIRSAPLLAVVAGAQIWASPATYEVETAEGPDVVVPLERPGVVRSPSTLPGLFADKESADV